MRVFFFVLFLISDILILHVLGFELLPEYTLFTVIREKERIIILN
jgi:hypothetical protein